MHKHQSILALFFASGTAALIYQICWQRLLFGAFGVDMDSITIIVSTFMLGLGLGALAGGALADRRPGHILPMFAAAEFGIALFGLASPQLIPWVGELFVAASRPVVATVNFALVSLPATLMGATLPMLIAHLYRSERNIGVSTGQLYFMNTLGAAVGAGATGFVMFRFLTLDQAIYIAAAINAAVGAGVLLGLRGRSS